MEDVSCVMSWQYKQQSASSWYDRVTNESWLRRSMGRRSLISGSPDISHSDVYLDIHHCDWCLRSYIEDILQQISLGWKKSRILGNSWVKWRTLLVCWAHLGACNSGRMSLWIDLLITLCRLDSVNLSSWLDVHVLPRQWMILMLMGWSLLKSLASNS